MKSWRVFLLPLLLGLPFIGRAYFVDDHYHMLMARGLERHPLRPYDFRADDAGPDNPAWERGQPPRMVNPPGHHFLLALFDRLSGGRLWAVRLGGLVLSSLAAVFTVLLARRFLVPPGPALLLTVVSPAFWLSSYALLIDSTLLTFFLAALWTWIEGLKRPSRRLLALSGLLMGLTSVVKYTGGFVVILAVLYWLMEKREVRRWWQPAFLLIPAAVLLAWSGWNVATYGAPHLTESSKRVMQSFDASHVLIFLVFFSGALLAPLTAWGWAWARPGRLAAAGLATLALAAFLGGPWGGFSLGQALALAFLAAGGALFFLRLPGLVKSSPAPGDAFLAAWLLLGAAQMVYVMQWVAARYYLTLLPPVVFLAYRGLELRRRGAPLALNRAWTALAGGMFLLTAGLARADFLQAETGRRVLADVRKDDWLKDGRRGFFLGDSFTHSYLKEAGWASAFPSTALRPGDLVLRQEVIMPAWWFRPAGRLAARKVYEYPSRWPLRVMDNQGSAGFYASAWGALPFTASTGPLERYVLLEVLE